VNIDYPAFFDVSRKATKRACIALAAAGLCFLAALVFEVASATIARAEAEAKMATLQRYQSLIAEHSSSSTREARYLAFTADLVTAQPVLSQVTPVETVLDYFEARLDGDSLVKRVIYEADKRQAIVHVLADNPLALERNINELVPNGTQSRVDILAKEVVKGATSTVAYELRVPL